MEIAPEAVLGGYGTPSLQHMARSRDLNLKGKDRAALITMLAEILYAPDAIATAFDDLTASERALLDRLILIGGEASTELVRHQLETEGVVAKRQKGPKRSVAADKALPWSRGSKNFDEIVARLGVLGLVYTADPVVGRGVVELGVPGRRLLIPDAVLEQLPRVVIATETTEPPPHVQPADPTALLRDIYSLLSFAADGALPLTARGQIAKRSLVKLDQALRVPEDAANARSEDDLMRLPLLRAVAETLGLLVAREGSLQLGEGAAAFLERPAGERQQQLYQAYRTTSNWSELARIKTGEVSVHTGLGRYAPPQAINARQRVLAELAELPGEAWITLGHLAGRLKRRAYEFLLPRPWEATYSYGYEVNPYPNYGNPFAWSINGVPDERSGWDLVEARFIRLVVQALHALGAVDLGGEGGEPTAFRLTGAGARLLQGETPLSIVAAPHVVVQPNFQMFAFEPTGEDVLFTLDRLAERVRAEQAVEYRLTRESVYRAQRQGLDVAAIIAFLERVSVAPLPQNVRRSLEEWGAQLDRIVVRQNVSLLQAVDAATLDALEADPAVRPLLGRRVAPTAMLVPAANLVPLSARLLKQGCLPALSEEHDDAPGPRLTADATGRISFRQRLPSVYVLHALQPFAEAQPDGTLRLTASSLRRAAKQQLTAEDVVATLERFHAGPLPPEVPALIRRWAKDWGRGALVEAAVLQVESPAILADLLADPEIAPYLQAVPGAPTLALVRGDQTALLRANLEERGMALGARLLR